MTFKNFGLIKFILLISLVSLFFVSTALATELTVPFPKSSVGGAVKSVSGPAEYVLTVYKYSVGVGVFLAMLMIIVGAIRYTVSEAIPSKGDAKDQITSAIWGLILLLGAFLIFSTINPQFETIKDPKPVIPPKVQGAPKAPNPTSSSIFNLQLNGRTLSWQYNGSANRFAIEFYESSFGVWRGFGQTSSHSFNLPSGTIYAGQQIRLRVTPILGSRFSGSRDSANISAPITIIMPR